MDGVLLKSTEAWYQLVLEAGRRWGGRDISREEFMPTFGQGTHADVVAFGLSCSPAQLDAFYVSDFARHGAHVWVDSEAADVLAQVNARGLQVALVTNTISPLAEKLIEGAGLTKHFAFIATPSNAGRPKPSPDMLLTALAALKVAQGDAWMVGDSRFDALAAKAAGVFFVGYRREGDVSARALSDVVALLG